MINLAQLLQPISPDDPCGVDLAYDPAMQELETLLLGKPETQFSPAEDPNWGALQRRSVELLERSKSLRVAVVLCLSLLQTEGVTGFRDGLAVVHGLIDQHWDALFPRLDPDDNNDPTERVNILTPLVTPLGSFDDPMQFLRRLRSAELTDSPRVGRFSLDQIAGTQPGESAPPVDGSQLRAAFEETGVEKLTALANAIVESTATAKELDTRLTALIGASRAPNWDPLIKTLDEMRKTIAPYLPAGTPGMASEGESDASATSTSATASAPGTIASRQDVLRTLDAICDYYQRTEPASPVPLLLKRARRLAEMNFLEIIGNLAPETLNSIQHITTGPEAGSDAPLNS